MSFVRHTHRAVIGVAVLWACSASAATFTEITNYPRGNRTFVDQVHSALCERCVVVSAAVPSKASLIRKQRTVLVEYKGIVTNLAHRYLDVSLMTDACFNVYYSNRHPDLTVPTNTISSLLAQCNLPDNYLTYTPYRMLSGVGIFTNDPTVDIPHGYTNANTTVSAGGTNFPAGRTNWYTTDYGWRGLTSIVHALRYTWTNITWVAIDTNLHKWEGYAANNIYDSSWSNAKALAEAAWKSTNYIAHQRPERYTTGWKTDYPGESGAYNQHNAAMRNLAGAGHVTNLSTSFSHRVQMYWHINWNLGAPEMDETNKDWYGANPLTTEWPSSAWTSGMFSASWTSMWYYLGVDGGAAWLPGTNLWCKQPAWNGTIISTGWTARGWITSTTGDIVQVDWFGAGGFNYQ